jgi:hypothetical protein
VAHFPQKFLFLQKPDSDTDNTSLPSPLIPSTQETLHIITRFPPDISQHCLYSILSHHNRASSKHLITVPRPSHHHHRAPFRLLITLHQLHIFSKMDPTFVFDQSVMPEQRKSAGMTTFIPPADIFPDTTLPSDPSGPSVSTCPSSYPQNNQDVSPQKPASAYPHQPYPEAFQHIGSFADETEPVTYPELDLADTSLEDITSATFEGIFGEGYDPFGVNSQPSMLGDMHQYNPPQSQLLPSNTQPYMHGAFPGQDFFNPMPQLQQQQEEGEVLPVFSPQEMLDALQYPTTQFLPPNPMAAFSTHNPPEYQQTQNNPPVPIPAQTLVAPQAVPGASRPPVNRNSNRPTRRAARADRLVISCDQCAYRCRYSEEMRRHRDSVHNNIRRHHCAVCNVYINDPSGLSKHKKSQKHIQQAKRAGVGMARSFAYECPECKQHGREAVYSRADHLKRHFQKNCGYTGGALPAGFFPGPGGMDQGRIEV